MLVSQVFPFLYILEESCVLSPALLRDWKPDGHSSPVGITTISLTIVPCMVALKLLLKKKKKRTCVQEEKIQVLNFSFLQLLC